MDALNTAPDKSAAAGPAVASNIVPRRMDFPFSEDIPRHWFAGSILGTHIRNVGNLIFPMGERFFIRSVRRFADRVADDPVLVAQVDAFLAQEGHHSREHERFFATLRAQGYNIDRFLALYRRIAWDPVTRLSMTVALEHYTAMFAEQGLARGSFDRAHPVMRDLFKWHAAEEIEHKAVAFDVLARVDPRYWTRIKGLILATAGLLMFLILGTSMLMKQEPLAVRRTVRELGQELLRERIARGDIRRAFIAYLRPSFHPSQIENTHLSRSYLASIGRATQ